MNTYHVHRYAQTDDPTDPVVVKAHHFVVENNVLRFLDDSGSNVAAFTTWSHVMKPEEAEVV